MNRLAFMERLAVPAIAAPVLRGARSKQEPMAWYCSLPGGGHTGWANPFAFVRAVRSMLDGPVVRLRRMLYTRCHDCTGCLMWAD
jgi:hypothetical protein